MTAFRYTGRFEGRKIQGQLEARTPDAIAGQLMERGIEPLTIKPIRMGMGHPLRFFATDRPTADDLILFARQMFTLTRSGIPLVRAFLGLQETARNPRLKTALGELVGDLQAGRTLSGALSAHPTVFGTLFPRIVRVGEEVGNLEESFRQLYQYLERDKEIRKRITTALRYPGFVLFAIILALFVFNIIVIPAFSGLFAKFGADLPPITRFLMATSDFARDYGAALLLAAGLAGYAFTLFIRSGAGRLWWDQVKLGLPLSGSIIHRASMARFARAFAMGSRSGLTVVHNLNVVADAVDNTFMAQHIATLRDGIERGESLTHAARQSDLFTPIVLQMMSVGEETGALDEVMTEVADFYEREVAYDLNNLSDTIEILLIAAVGGLVLVLALGVFLPMWDLGAAALKR